MTTIVVNRNRMMSRDQHCVSIMRPGPWGNPFRIGRDGTREEVVDKFAAWFTTSRDPRAEWMRVNLEKLRGKTLMCCCSPLPCHGDVLAAWLNKDEFASIDELANTNYGGTD